MSYYNTPINANERQYSQYYDPNNNIQHQQVNLQSNNPYGYPQQFLHQQSHSAPKHPPSHPYVVIPQTSSSPIRQHVPYTPQHTSSSSPPKLYPQIAISQSPRRQSHAPVAYIPQNAVPSSGQYVKRSPSANAQSLPHNLRYVLLTLADEYITAARALLPLDEDDALWKRYFRLMAMGIGCLEAVLKKFKIFPREEAELRLRYALLLYEETNNDLEVEEVLSKGIVLSERSRFVDLKYSMTLLLARATYRTKYGAASNMLDKAADDAEAYQHMSWVYAIRFLRVSFALQDESQHEKTSAISNLRHIAQLAERLGDHAIFVASAAFEAVLHIRSNQSNSIENAQGAIASARKLQLNLDPQQYPQLIAMVICADLACSLRQNQPEQMLEKLQNMQDFVDSMNKSSSWSDDGTFGIPIHNAPGGSHTANTAGIFRKAENGSDLLTLSWLGKKDFYTLGYYLSGLSHFLKNNIDLKAERFFVEGLRNVQNVKNASGLTKWQSQLTRMMQLHLILTYCSRTDWNSAEEALNKLGPSSSFNPSKTDSFADMLEFYLKGVIAQGKGNLSAAEQIYTSKIFLDRVRDPRSQGPVRDLAILANLNALVMLHNRTSAVLEQRSQSLNNNNNNPSHVKIEPNTSTPISSIPSVTDLEPLCQTHPNRALVSTYQLAATVAGDPDATTIKVKQHLRIAIQSARETGRPQLLALTMNLLTEKFFKDIVGQQTEKCANTGRNLAQRAGDPLWIAVADEMYASALERNGDGARADELRVEGFEHLEKVPIGVREGMGLEC